MNNNITKIRKRNIIISILMAVILGEATFIIWLFNYAYMIVDMGV